MICFPGSAGLRCGACNDWLAAIFQVPGTTGGLSFSVTWRDQGGQATEHLFTSIVNLAPWIARRPTYKITTVHRSGTDTAMSAASGDDIASDHPDAGKTSPAARSVTVSGNRLDSRELFATEREIIISHGEEAYRLRLTSLNKLILTK
jgi:hemin uptake protein HemP